MAPGMSAVETKMCLEEHRPPSRLWALDVLQPTLTSIKFGRRDLGFYLLSKDSLWWRGMGALYGTKLPQWYGLQRNTWGPHLRVGEELP